jgi:hypothetical protein
VLNSTPRVFRSEQRGRERRSYDRLMKHQSTSRTSTAGGAAHSPRAPRQQPRLAAQIGQQIDDIYVQMDDQLTRMAEIQLQFDRLRAQIRLL